MRIVLHVHDDLYQRYERESDDRNIPVASVLEDRLVAAVPLDPRSPFLVVTGDALKALEAATGHLPLITPAGLVAKVERLARIKFGDHVLTLTPGQYEEIAWRANKQGKTIEQMIEIAFRTFAEQFFTLVP